MPATLPSLYTSALRMHRKQHIMRTDTGGGDTLLKIVPYRGTKMVAFSFWCKGVTQFNVNSGRNEYVKKQGGRNILMRNGVAVGTAFPVPHKQIIAFTDCNILPDGEVPSDEEKGNYFVLNYKGEDYWVEKINLRKQKAVVRCDCKDFIFTWSYSDFKHACLWGPPPKKYIRKTPPPPKGRPYRNPSQFPGYCKHIFFIYKNFMLNKHEYGWADTGQAVSGSTYFVQ